jgi:anti-anti-sigma factor
MPSSRLPRHPDDFSVHVRRDDRTMHITIAGELDLASGPDLMVAVDGGPDDVDVVVDAEGLTFIDAAGLRFLLAAVARRSARVVNVSPAVRRLFDITRMDEVLDYGPSSTDGERPS